jgi:transposase-like protein
MHRQTLGSFRTFWSPRGFQVFVVRKQVKTRGSMLVKSFYQNVIPSEAVAVQYLIENQIFEAEKQCSCGATITFSSTNTEKRCTKKTCRKRHSITHNTIFQSSNLKVTDILELIYLKICLNSRYQDVISCTTLTSKTITKWTRYIQQIMANDLEVDDIKVGGPGIVVEIDESKFGKRKYNRGHRVEGVWVVGGIERTEQKRFFLVPVANRNAQTLEAIIRTYVHAGSIIHTDMWRGYGVAIENIGNLEHYQVNHSANFVDPDTGVHTNTIEGKWSSLKRQIPIRKRTEQLIELEMYCTMWKNKNRDNLWPAFMQALKDAHFD